MIFTFFSKRCQARFACLLLCKILAFKIIILVWNLLLLICRNLELLILSLMWLLLSSCLKSLLLIHSIKLLLLECSLLSLSLLCCQLCFLLLANNLQLSYFFILRLFLFQSLSFHLTLICFLLQCFCSRLNIDIHLRLIILLILLLNKLLLLCILH